MSPFHGDRSTRNRHSVVENQHLAPFQTIDENDTNLWKIKSYTISLVEQPNPPPLIWSLLHIVNTGDCTLATAKKKFADH
jgi:hypothetical protein